MEIHGTSILCPFDRQPTEIGDSGVWGLKKNFALLELLEKLQFTSQNATILNIFTQQSLEKEKEVGIIYRLLKRYKVSQKTKWMLKFYTIYSFIL